MVKCENCGNLQPGNKIDICRKNECGFICYPVKTERAKTKKPPEADKELED